MLGLSRSGSAAAALAGGSLLALATTGCELVLGSPFDGYHAAKDAAVAPHPEPDEDAGALAVDAGPHDAHGVHDAPEAGTPSTMRARSGATTSPQSSSSGTANGSSGAPPVSPNHSDGDDDAGTLAPRSLDGCMPGFDVANNIVYPEHSAGALVLSSNKIDTDHDEHCDPANKEYCVIIADSIEIPSSVDQHRPIEGVVPRGRRALVLLAARDIHIDGIINMAGFDGWEEASLDNRAPGDHSRGMASHAAGGGGNATAGGGTCEGAGAGPKVLLSAGLVGGGHGSPDPDPLDLGCTAGGGGGGALQIVSLCGTIYITDFINARGGGGIGGAQNSDRCRDGNGGGAGGTLWLQGKVKIGSPDGKMPLLQFNGGGGGGGSCLQADATTVVPGKTGGAGLGAAPAEGAVCEGDARGGLGGRGGFGDMSPTAAAKGTSESARCGGGGGARGRLILQNVPVSCDDLVGLSDGACVTAPPL